MSIQNLFSSITSPSSSSDWKYDVFLSFRGEDICTNFVDHFYHALKNKGINVFKDDKRLVHGEDITLGLVKAIEKSRFMIVIFSENYASSTWCLDELLQIVECKNISEEVIFPIFYKLDPSEVRKQIGKFHEAFVKHEDNFRDNAQKVQKWKVALRKVANIKGWDSKNRHEVELIQEIVKEISKKLGSTILKTFDDLVGIDQRVEALRLLLDTGSNNNVLMIGIYGMGGLGKTTIARVVYDLISHEFENKSFLANVRETSKMGGLIPLQKQLFSELLMLEDTSIWNVDDGINMIRSRLRSKKILLVIDDVDDEEQLRSLAGNHDWFGQGSKIVITSRDKHLLESHGVDEVYKPKELSGEEALRLFCSKAFKTHEPVKEYALLSKIVVEYADGLPLALKVFGSFLFGRTIDEWESAIHRFEKDLEKGILDVLQISFDGLNEIDKRIFLDIACFFKGDDKDYVIKILAGCGFDPVIGIRLLIDKSLIIILDDNRVRMHDLLQEMGQQIVKRQASQELGKCSRLWKEEDICHVLTENTGTEVIESIILKFSKDEVCLSVSAEAFSKMTRLRLLKIHNVQLPKGLNYLSNELRLLEWHGYPLKSLPSNLQFDRIVELRMPHSCIQQLWTGIKTSSNLKLVRLNNSNNLTRTPDFTGVPNLEELILEGCTRLHEVHPSVFFHKNLIILNLQDCKSLKTLPSEICMKSLQNLVLSGCSKLKKFPDIVGSMEYLSELHLDGTAIEELPSSLVVLSGLVLLGLNCCINLVRLPNAINSLKSLKTLNLSGCSKLENVPENLGQLESLEELDISGTAITRPMLSIFLMKNLKALSFRGCKGPLTYKPWYLRFPISLMQRSPDPMKASMLPPLSGLISLTKLDLSDCNLEEGGVPSDIGNLVSLKKLDLSKNNFVSLPGAINCLLKLTDLRLEDCKQLQSLPKLPNNIWRVMLRGCSSLKALSLTNALESCNSSSVHVNSVNCLELLGNQSFASSMLKQFLEVESIPRRWVNILAPGSKIPEWFHYQEEGSSITIRKPPYSYHKYKLKGYAICCVFHVSKHSNNLRKYFHVVEMKAYDDLKKYTSASISSQLAN